MARGCFLASADSSRTVAGGWELSGEGFIDRTDMSKGTEVMSVLSVLRKMSGVRVVESGCEWAEGVGSEGMEKITRNEVRQTDRSLAPQMKRRAYYVPCTALGTGGTWSVR